MSGKWSAEERSLLREKGKTHGARWVAKRLERKERSVRRKACRLGMKLLPTKEDFAACFAAFRGQSVEWYAAQLGVSVRTVYNQMMNRV